MFVYNHKFEAVLLIVISILAGLLISQYNSRTLWSAGAASNFSGDNRELLIVPEPTGEQSQETIITEISSDGSRKAMLKILDTGQNVRDFALYTQDESGSDTNLVYSKRLYGDSGILLPFNMWSPDNRYFFIKEYTPEDVSIKVFNSDGGLFMDGRSYLDLVEDFESGDYGFVFQEATGWGGYNLIVFNSENEKKEQGPSFWYELPGRSVIRLSTLFL